MAAQQRAPPPGNSVYIVLRATDPVSYRDGYIADVMRLHLGTPGGVHPKDPSVAPGIYMHEGEMYEKPSPQRPTFSHAAAPDAASPRPTLGMSNMQLVMAQSALVCSAAPGAPPRLAPPPPSNFTPDPKFVVRGPTLDDKERTPTASLGGLSKITAADGHPYIFSYCAELIIYPDGSLGPVEILGDGGKLRVVVYFLRLDTGGMADSWVFGNIPWERFCRLSKNSVYTDQQLQAAFSKKNLMPFPRYDGEKEDWAELGYGVGADDLTTVSVKQGLCGIAFGHWERPIRISKFPIGVVYGAHDMHILTGFDGLLGLGRGIASESRMPVGARYGPAVTLPEALFRQKLIKSRNFWIHITHPTWDEPGRDFMCLGDYHNPHDSTIPKWLDVDCSVDTAVWEVDLSRIEVIDPAHPQSHLVKHSFRRLKVMVDSGCMQSFLPLDFVSKVEGMFSKGYNVPRGSASYELPKSLVIRFYFGVDGSRCIDGQAIRFLISPDYVPGDDPAIGLKYSDRAILGLNFFRTFVVGFKDHETKPQISLAKHPDVPAGKQHISACKDALTRRAAQPAPQPQPGTYETGASTAGRPTSDATRGAAPGAKSTSTTGATGHLPSGKGQKLHKAPSQSATGLVPHQRLGSSSTRVRIPEDTQSHAQQNPRGRSHVPDGSQSSTKPAGQHSTAPLRNPAADTQRDYLPAQPEQLLFPGAGDGQGSGLESREHRVSHLQSQQYPQQPGGEASSLAQRTHYRSASQQYLHTYGDEVSAPQSAGGYRTAPSAPDPYANSYAPGVQHGASGQHADPYLPQPQSYSQGLYPPVQHPDAQRSSQNLVPSGQGFLAPPPEQRERRASLSQGAAPGVSGDSEPWHPRKYAGDRPAQQRQRQTSISYGAAPAHLGAQQPWHPGQAPHPQSYGAVPGYLPNGQPQWYHPSQGPPPQMGAPLQRSVSNTYPHAPFPGSQRPPAQNPAPGYGPVIPPAERPRKLSTAFKNMNPFARR
ncbi:hypothetical protein AURDEDRAFT_187214 [Auricularia subglabra TFB-10046 SS5]|nr:hypothetical protein AURDEDRAFT_187214 [Auricularia subglabra TFB-10046 SS5]